MDTELERLRETLAQVHRDSREIEAELEAELEAREADCAALEQQLHNALAEANNWHTQCVSTQQHNDRLQVELDARHKELSCVKAQIHALETENDEWELKTRVSQGSIEALQAENQRLLEKLALSSVDMAHQEQLTTELQRTKDELAEAHEDIRSLQRATSLTGPNSNAAQAPLPTVSLQSVTDIVDQAGSLHNQARRTSQAQPLIPSRVRQTQPQAHQTLHPELPVVHKAPTLGAGLHPTKLRSNEWILADVKPSQVNSIPLRPLCDAGKISQGRGHGVANR